MPSHPDLDYRFLRYIGASIDGEAAMHACYVPMLADRSRVLDLGCGLGGFVKLLLAAGVDAYGVDSDAGCIEEARSHQIPVVEADIIEHLRTLEPASLDAIFSGHVVEHMPYGVVLETIELAYRALKPGGRLLLATPNPRALVSHLELYSMHFGHVAMYHPKLLAFFMQYAGFSTTTMGENPNTMAIHIAGDSPLAISQWHDAPAPLQSLAPAVEQVLPKPSNWMRKLAWHIKMPLVRWLVQPYYDQMGREVAQIDAARMRAETTLRDLVEAIDRPFECYVIGDKSESA